MEELRNKNGMGNGAATCGDGVFEVERIFQIMQMSYELSVVHQRHKYRFRASTCIHQKLFRSDRHETSIPQGCENVY